MLAWDDRPVHENTFKTYIEFTSIGIFAKASWLRNFTQSFTALPMLFKRFYGACLWRSLDIFPRTLKEKQSPESLYGKIAGFFFVICLPERLYVRKTLGHWTKYFNLNRRNSLRWFWFAVFKPVKRDTRWADYVWSGFRSRFLCFSP